MKVKKVFLSLFLLLIYSFGFAHNVIPHDEESRGGEHQHEHHVHAAYEKETHQHIQHQNHFDQSVFDLIVCLFSEINHSEGVFQEYLCSSSKTVNQSDLKFSKVKTNLILAVSPVVYEQVPLSNFIKNDFEQNYFSLIPKPNPLRGPPIFL